MQFAQRRRGQHAEGVVQRGPDAFVRDQGLGLPVGLAQCPDQQAGGALPQRVCVAEGAQFQDRPRRLAEPDPDVGPVLGRIEPDLLEPAGGAGGEVVGGEVHQGCAAPQVQALGQCVGGLGGRSRAQLPPAEGGEVLEAMGVDLARIGRQFVAAGPGDDGEVVDVVPPQRLAGTGDQAVECAGPVTGRVVLPQVVDERAGGDQRTG